MNEGKLSTLINRRRNLILLAALPIATLSIAGCGTSEIESTVDARTNPAAVRALILVSLLVIESIETDAVVINGFRFFFSIIEVFLLDGSPATTSALKTKQTVKITSVANSSPERWRIQILTG